MILVAQSNILRHIHLDGHGEEFTTEDLKQLS